VEVLRIREGLWRWTAPHPDWDPGGQAGSDWPELVGCVYYEAPAATVLIDPLAPPEEDPEQQRFWRALDRDVERRGVPVAVLRTVHWHDRNVTEVRERYPEYEGVPDGVEAFPLGDPIGETVFWIAEHGALVPGDILLGDDAGGLRVCPPSWYDNTEAERQWYREDLRAALEPLLELPVEMVLVSHWEPVLEDGARKLRAAVEAAGEGA
jgi:hypothetical protein